MTEFRETKWSQGEYGDRYIDAADVIVIERRRMFEIVKSFYRFNVAPKDKRTVLDLGCGDGIVARRLLEIDDALSATLVDGSDEMLEKARALLKGYRNVSLLRASFQELLSGEIRLPRPYSLVVSALAIHHLTTEEKRALFEMIHAHLEEGGFFLNIDTTLSPSESLEEWYRELWREWINEQRERRGVEGHYEEFIEKYHDEAHYQNLDTLRSQLHSLEDAGFHDVDCFYKYGMISLYGGRR